MKPLIEEIHEILTPGKAPGIIKDGKIYQLQPVLPISILIEIAEELDDAAQQQILDFLQEEGSVILNGVLYIATKGLNLQGRLKEILAAYHTHLKQVVGDKRALIDLYDKIPVEDIANLTEDHVIFVMKQLMREKKKGLAAIRYLPEYEVHFDRHVYQFPSCTIAIPIDDNLIIGNPEVMAEKPYEHPFVYKDKYIYGQKICMGSFYSSEDSKKFDALRFANNINNRIKQAVQILVSGYNRKVTPANGHLGTPQYARFLKSTL